MGCEVGLVEGVGAGDGAVASRRESVACGEGGGGG